MVQTPTTLETRGAELPVWSWERDGRLSNPGERCHLSIHRPAQSNLTQKARLARSSTHRHPWRRRGSRGGHEPCVLRELPGGGKKGETIQNSTHHCLGFLFVWLSPTPPGRSVCMAPAAPAGLTAALHPPDPGPRPSPGTGPGRPAGSKPPRLRTQQEKAGGRRRRPDSP